MNGGAAEVLGARVESFRQLEKLFILNHYLNARIRFLKPRAFIRKELKDQET